MGISYTSHERYIQAGLLWMMLVANVWSQSKKDKKSFTSINRRIQHKKSLMLKNPVLRGTLNAENVKGKKTANRLTFVATMSLTFSE